MSNAPEQPAGGSGSGERPRLLDSASADNAKHPGSGDGYGRYDYYDTQGTAGPPDLMFYVRMLYRRRWTAVAAFVVVFTLTVLHSYTAVSVYEARVRVLTDASQLNLVAVPDLLQQNRTDTQQAILRSRWLAKRTLEDLKLLPPAAGAAAPSTAAVSNKGSWVSRAIALLASPYHWAVDPPKVNVDNLQSGETPAEAAMINGFLGGLVLPPQQTGLMEIGYRSSDPVEAARIANAITQTYIQVTAETRATAGRDVADWLSARLAEQRQSIETSEQALQKFRNTNGILASGDSDGPTPTDERLTTLNASIVRARAVVIEKEALLKQAQSMRNDPAAFEMLAGMLQTPGVQEARKALSDLMRERAAASEQLGDRHPQMLKFNDTIQSAQRQLRAEIDRAIGTLTGDHAVAVEAAERLERSMATERRDAIAMNRKSTELRILERDVDSNRQIYQMLAQRSRETTLAEKVEPRSIRVLDPAQVPLTPISPNKKRNLLLGILGGLLLGVALAFGFELLDNRIKHPDQIEPLLKVPYLGYVPRVPGNPDDPSPLVTSGAPLHFVEAIRRLRTNVLFSFAGDEPKTLVITSAAAGEGKTVVSSNLAASLAQSGQRVLVIDADMRRPRLHQVFGKAKEPGLSHLLVGKSKLSEVTLQTLVPRLFIIPSGHRPPNAAELLGSPAYTKVLSAVREHFDWIVVDCPPIMAVADAAIAAHVADGIVFVVGAEMASHQVVRRAIEQCRIANVNVVGAILNRIETDKHSYYYAPHYQPDYEQYFGNKPEKKSKSA